MTDPFHTVRAHCLAIEGVTERVSHGSACFFAPGTRGKQFVACVDDHHGDGILGLWIAAPPGSQEARVAADPDTFFRPPYVGGRGWLGVRLDRHLPADELAGLLDDAFETVT